MVQIDLKRHKVVMTMALYEASRIGELLKAGAENAGISDPSLHTIVETLCGVGDQVIVIV